MNIFYRRPLMVCCAVFLFVSALAFFVNGFTKQILTLAFFLSASFVPVIAVVVREKSTRINFAVTAVALVLGALAVLQSWAYFDFYARSADKYIGNKCALHATVIDERRATVYESEYAVELESINGNEASGRAILYFDSPVGLSSGEVILLPADCIELGELSYDDTARRGALADGMLNAAFSVTDSETLDIEVLGKTELYTDVMDNLNSRLGLRLERNIGGEAGRLASAMVLGRRQYLSPETNRDFARTGLSHILSISGLHMAMLAGFFELLLRRLRVPKVARCCVMPFAMLGYLMLTGFQISAVRSAAMLTVVYMSFVLSSPSDIITVLFAVCAGIVALIPSSAADVGFWMSFLATMGIIVVSPYASALFKRRQKDALHLRMLKTVLRYIISSVAVTLAAVLAISLLTLLCFGETSLVAPIANLYASPLTTCLMVLSVMSLVFGGLPSIGGFISELAEAVGNGMLGLTAELSDLRGITVSLEYDFAKIIVVLFCISMAVVLIVNFRHKIFALIPPVSAVAAFAICLIVTNAAGADELSLSYIRRGEREMLLMSQNGTAVLCDFTDGSYSNHAAAWKLAKEECATELEAFVLTHYHDRHRGSTERLLSAIKVRSVWLPEPKNEDEFYIAREIARISEEHGAETLLYSFDEELTVFEKGSVVLKEPIYIDRSKQPMLSLELEFGESRAVYIGSSYLETKELSGELDALILGTHGPNPKAEYSLPLSENTKTAVFAERELFDLARPTIALPEDTVIDCEYKKIILN